MSEEDEIGDMDMEVEEVTLPGDEIMEEGDVTGNDVEETLRARLLEAEVEGNLIRQKSPFFIWLNLDISTNMFFWLILHLWIRQKNG